METAKVSFISNPPCTAAGNTAMKPGARRVPRPISPKRISRTDETAPAEATGLRPPRAIEQAAACRHGIVKKPFQSTTVVAGRKVAEGGDSGSVRCLAVGWQAADPERVSGLRGNRLEL